MTWQFPFPQGNISFDVVAWVTIDLASGSRFFFFYPLGLGYVVQYSQRVRGNQEVVHFYEEEERKEWYNTAFKSGPPSDSGREKGWLFFF